MKRICLILLICVSGCTRWTAAQIDLVTQSRRGLALIAQNDEQRDRAIEELSKLRRQRLDEAFDADVREREILDADWVIDSRKAYATAIDALARQSAAGAAAAESRRRNLADIDSALARLQWLQSIQLKLTPKLAILEGQP